MVQKARPVVITNQGEPVTPTAAYGEPVTVVGGVYAVLAEGDTIDTDGGGSVSIDTIEDGVVTAATYTAP
jgi:hypothetical protein